MLPGIGCIPAAYRPPAASGRLGRAGHARHDRRRLDPALGHPGDDLGAEQPLDIDTVTRLGLDGDPHHLCDVRELRHANHLWRLAEPRVERRL